MLDLSKTYCIVDKRDTGNVSSHLVQTKSGRFQLASICSVCKKQKRRFLSKAEVSQLDALAKKQGGKGIFDFLGKDVGGFLNRVGNTLIDTALPIGASLAGRALGGLAM